jgi:hypothetical protein
MLDSIVERIRGETIVQVITNNPANYKARMELLMGKRKMIVFDTMWYPLY